MFNKIDIQSKNLNKSLNKKAEMIKRNVSSPSGMTRLADAQVVRVAPRPFSPFYEESNLMLPRDRREVNAWARHYYATDPWVGNALDLHSTYPLSSFGVKSDDPSITKFFNSMLEELNFDSMIYDVGKEYHIIGEVFPYSEIDLHTGKWVKIIIQNPDYVEVKSHMLTEPVISLMPDEELKRIVTSTNPDDVALRNQLPQEVLAYVYAGKNIPLDQTFISHLARKNSPYDVRGTSILTRVFKDLMYRDKLRESQFAIADNHVTPLKIFKVGTADGTYRPTGEDLQAFREMLEQATYDPNFTLVTHPGLEVQYVGSTGVILPLDGEMDRIEDRVLTGLFTSKAFTHCLTEDTETLTKDGWKFYDQINEDDEIATVNPETNKLEYHKYNKKFVYDINEEIVHFKSNAFDHAVTKNHKVWVSKKNENNYHGLEAEKVDHTYKFATTFDWDGKKEECIKIGSKNIPINDYMLLTGLYLSEGCVYYSNDKFHRETGLKSKALGIIISQAKYHKFGLNERYDTIKEILKRNYKVTELSDPRREKTVVDNNVLVREGNDTSEGFLISDQELASHLLLTYGNSSSTKYIPSFIKEYEKESLASLLEGCRLGDGSKLNKNNSNSYEIYTISKKMSDDLQEIALKCGHVCFIGVRTNRPGNRRDCYRVRIFIKGNSKKEMYKNPTISKNKIKKINYNGKVFCFDVPNHLFVVRKNGKVILTKNSDGPTYSNASVALEVLQQRYVSFRTLIEKWLEWKIFRPICKLQGFTRIRGGMEELIMPKVNWDKINLKNNREYQQALEGLVRDNKVSLHTLHKALDVSYEEEMDNIKKEIEDMKEIAYKLEQAYTGPENINVSEEGKKDVPTPVQETEGEEGPPAEGGGMDFGGGGGGGGDMGGGGDLKSILGGGETGGEAGASETGAPPSGGAGTEAPQI